VGEDQPLHKQDQGHQIAQMLSRPLLGDGPLPEGEQAAAGLIEEIPSSSGTGVLRGRAQGEGPNRVVAIALGEGSARLFSWAVDLDGGCSREILLNQDRRDGPAIPAAAFAAASSGTAEPGRTTINHAG